MLQYINSLEFEKYYLIPAEKKPMRNQFKLKKYKLCYLKK